MSGRGVEVSLGGVIGKVCTLCTVRVDTVEFQMMEATGAQWSCLPTVGLLCLDCCALIMKCSDVEIWKSIFIWRRVIKSY